MDHHNTTEISPRLAAALDLLEDITAENTGEGTSNRKTAANMNRQSIRPHHKNGRSPDNSS